jgi:hypothetical protein
LRPTTISFTSKSSAAGGFTYSGTAGCYKVTVAVLSGETYSNSSSLIYIRSSKTAPNPPVLQQAQFSNDGRSLTVQFDSQTDYGITRYTDAITSSVMCSSYLSFTGASAIPCYWTSRSTVVAVLSANSSAVSKLVRGSNVTLVKQVIKPYCTGTLKCQYANASTVHVLAPSSAQVPVVTLQAASVLGACNDLTIDPTATTGQGGRSWSSVSWRVDAASGSLYPASNMTQVQTYLATNYKDGTNSIITIPNRYLLPGAIYRIFLTVQTFLGASGTGALTVQV